MLLLLDPALLVLPSSTASEAEWTKFWLRLVEWHLDNRVRIGAATSLELTAQTAVWGAVDDPSNDYPPHTRNDRRRIVTSLLSRVLPPHHKKPADAFDPTYLGPPNAWAILATDIRHCANAEENVGALATDVTLWPTSTDKVGSLPPPPTGVQLVYAPNAPLADEARVRASATLGSHKLRIVGGSVEPRIIERLEREYGLKPGHIDWESCERNKKPKFRSWTGMQAGIDIAICITGHIGHTSSEKAAKLAVSAGVTWVPVQRIGELFTELEQRFGHE